MNDYEYDWTQENFEDTIQRYHQEPQDTEPTTDDRTLAIYLATATDLELDQYIFSRRQNISHKYLEV